MADLNEYMTKRMVAWFQLYTDKKFEELMALYTDDCRLYPPGAETAIGKAAVREYLVQLQKNEIPALQLIGVMELIQFSDEYLWINNNCSEVNTGGSVPSNYRDGSVWKKVGEEWCLHRDFYNHRPK